MRLNQAQVARHVNRLAGLKAKIAKLQDKENTEVLVLKAAGGGESSKYIAKIVKVPEKLVVVKAHKQLRVYPKEG